MPTPFADLLTGIKTRLVTNLGKLPADGYVRVVLSPSPDLDYKAEEGVHLLVGPAEPFVPSGGNRHAYRTRRVLTVVVVTRNNLDAVGSDDVACAAHVTLEERVVDAIHDHRSTTPVPVGTYCRWVGTGAGPVRRIKVDAGSIYTQTQFELVYPLNFSVT